MNYERDKMKYKFLVVLSAVILFTACEEVNEPEGTNIGGTWDLPSDRIYDGGPGKDGIPALSNPEFITATQVDFLDENDLVVGIRVGDEIRAYPHKILDWHEIVNDDFATGNIAITYCPLTGSAIGWNRNINGNVTTFGVSGLLYNTNLMPYDRASNSTWSQMSLKCVNGSLIGRPADLYPLVETNFGTWLKMFPDSKVQTLNTGYDRDGYVNSPYGDYRENHERFLFPPDFIDGRYDSKEEVLGISIGEESIAYNISNFGDGISIIDTTLAGNKILIVGSGSDYFAAAFNFPIHSGDIEFSPLENSYPLVFKDNEENKYDIFGRVLEGPRTGEKLSNPTSYVAYWFAWAVFNIGTEIGN